MKNKLTPEHCLKRFELCRSIIEAIMVEGKYPFTTPLIEPYKKWDEYAKFYIRNVSIYKPPHGFVIRKTPRKLKKILKSHK